MKTTPWRHQAETFERSKDLPAFAVLYEQRCGKSWVALATAVHLYGSGEIDAMIILAPNGVHTNWVKDELIKHWPEEVPYSALVWSASKASTLQFKRAAAALLAYSPGVAVLAINAEGLITEAAKAYLKKFLTKRRCLYICDESDVFAHPGAKRTKVALAASKYASYRRILTGTPVAESPLDAYAQFKILDPAILGHTSYFSFKAHYAEYEEGYDPRTGRRYPKLLGYKNLEELQSRISAHSIRVTRSEVSDAPPKLYIKRHFSLSPTQRAVYNELREQYVAELSDGDGTISAVNILARYTRLQQISSNIAVTDLTAIGCPRCAATDPECPTCEGLGVIVPEREDKLVDPKLNPRLTAYLEEVSRSPGPSIVWCKFNRDVDDVLAALRALGRRPVRYDGHASISEREEAKTSFRSGAATDFVGKAASGGRGLDLSVAETVYFYSHAFPLRLRLQGEDRGEGLLKSFSTVIVDLIGEDTIDEKIVTSLRDKRSLSDSITGDDPEEWI